MLPVLECVVRNGMPESHDDAGFGVCRAKWDAGIARCCQFWSVSCEMGCWNRTMMPILECVVRNGMSESHDVDVFIQSLRIYLNKKGQSAH